MLRRTVGGHTPLFSTVVSQCNIDSRHKNDAAMTMLLLEHGADPNVRVSIRKQLRDWDDESMHEYRDVTPLSYGQSFHAQRFVDPTVLQLLDKVQ